VISIIIVDDHPLVRRGLRETFAAEPDMTVVAEATNSEEVLPALAGQRCDVLVLDLSLPGRGGLEVLRDVRRDFPRVRVVVVTTHDALHFAVRCLRAGAGAYVAKSAGPEEVVSAVREVFRTGRHISDEVASALADFAVIDESVMPAHQRLSDREHDVLRRLVNGKTVSEIAADLSLSVKTVSTYRTRMIEKLGVRTTADLVRYAVEQKLFE
jgi:two-component system invasion response regulator UvrY